MIFATTFIACSDDDSDPAPMAESDIVELAIATSDLSNLVAALTKADLVSALQADGNFTVLAPTNAAFTRFLADNEFDSLDDVPDELLKQVLLNHVIAGDTPLKASDLIALGAGYTNTLADGPTAESNLSIYFNTSDGVTFNGSSTVDTADIMATNGVIHIVDEVITLPTVTDFAVADSDTFSTLVSALTTLTPETDFAGILSRTEGGNEDMINPSFTVFAPTNDAFAALESIPEEDVLTQVLLHHVVAGANVRSSDLTNPDDTMPTILEGDDITITLPGTENNIANIVDGGNNDGIGIIVVDVQAVNGVIHVLNKVMIPNLDN